MRFLIFICLALILALPAQAENKSPYSGTKIIQTGKPFAGYLKSLKSAIRSNKMGIVSIACATCGAKAIGVTIPGNRVIMIYNPHFAVRMLKASVEAGVEAPLRLYVTENKNGTAKLSYRLPSHVFAPYDVASLNTMAKELDSIVQKIIADADK
ncbi:MAG: DUF302 domain-containing protein [Rhodospirillaceae bacterium]|jgi:uncharacterized protein (DUF302 family)|nr:DUF302 domain-containing protein [Rhodospirillales bacterium]MBT3906794.1 DUF302 domain-containing protein [Rhodospirillaceae bacterium]MBT4703715.1 DUF302 domain-containing protein [Rhodospirillaceae bacterium]MBT5035842.1 DUF302 domain-containing protein [Rhodospirillaceae bacterium]MBT6221996.1 DUF302 domain-containing protein [Rhodospirillaceae bacterium]